MLSAKATAIALFASQTSLCKSKPARIGVFFLFYPKGRMTKNQGSRHFSSLRHHRHVRSFDSSSYEYDKPETWPSDPSRVLLGLCGVLYEFCML